MVDKTPDVKAALSAEFGEEMVYPIYPNSFNDLPIAAYYEASNTPSKFGDDQEWSSDIAFQVDIWNKAGDSVSDLAIRADKAMNSIGFIRETSSTFPEGNGLIHKTMRFAGLFANTDEEMED